MSCFAGLCAEKPSGNLTIGYHGIRGLAAPLRMMCYYRSQPFTEVAYGADLGDAWAGKAKPELQKLNSAINLPYILNGDKTVTQTNTCLLYLGKLLQIDKKQDDLHNHMVLDQTYDWRNDLMMMVYPPGVIIGACTKDDWAEKAPKHVEGPTMINLKKLEGLCKGLYMCGGSTPQSGDFHVFEMIDQHKILAKHLGMPDPTAGFPKMQKLWEAFKADPKLAKYWESDCYKYPLNNPLATNWTGLAADFQYPVTQTFKRSM